MKTLRLSITVPNFNINDKYDPLEYFKKMKKITVDIINKALENGVKPYYDCNSIPNCIIPNEEKRKWIYKFQDNRVTNILSNDKNCVPVIDILPDLSVIRCMGLSSNEKVNLFDFANITDVRNYFINEIDVYKNIITYSDKCKRCYYNKVRKCNGGCLAYKGNLIKDLKQRINNIE